MKNLFSVHEDKINENNTINNLSSMIPHPLDEATAAVQTTKI